MAHIKSQLKTNNFFLVQLLYVNGCTGIAGQLEELFDLVRRNRVLNFLGFFPREYLVLCNGFLGAALGQGYGQDGERVLGACVRLLGRGDVQDLGKLFNKLHEETKPVCQQFFILLTLAIARLPAQSPQKTSLTEISNLILSQHPQLKSQILQSIRSSTLTQLPNPLPNHLKSDPVTGLPTHQTKPILVDREQPGYTKLVAQYLKLEYKVQGIEIINADEIDVRLGVGGSGQGQGKKQ